MADSPGFVALNVKGSLPATAATARRSAPEVVPRAATAGGAGARHAGVAGWSTAAAGAAVLVRGAKRRSARRWSGRARPTAVAATATLEKTAVGEDTDGWVARDDIRNIAIIAHVDHGKTTITDAMMKQSGKEDNDSMDSNALEAERGITILAKNASIEVDGIKVNIIDTPGHADFGGEVERILNMADACLLLVDAQEGPMPQTKFVLRKALQLQKKVIVCINKVDKPAARCDWVLDKTFDLFMALGASDELADFPTVYASGLQGKASFDDPEALTENLTPLIQTIIKETPKPMVDPKRPLQMLVTNLDYDPYVGRITIGRLTGGSLKVGDKIGAMYGEGSELRETKVTKLWDFHHNGRREVEEVKAGDICAFTGFTDVTIGDTIVDLEHQLPMTPIDVEEPSVALEFMANRGPLMGKDPDTKMQTAAAIKARLDKEVLTNLALRIEDTGSAESFVVKGRGTLQLGILMEEMRREGYEMMIGPPKVLTRTTEDGTVEEPLEEITVEVPMEHQEAVMEEFTRKEAHVMSMEAGAEENSQVLVFEMPTRMMIGMQGILMTKTRGSACLSSQKAGWVASNKETKKLRTKGSLINTDNGKATIYAMEKMDKKGRFFIKPGDDCFPGMCIGTVNTEADVKCNITKEKKVTNMRAASADDKVKISEPLQWSIDDFLGHMDTDEALEITPNNLRLVKRNYK